MVPVMAAHEQEDLHQTQETSPLTNGVTNSLHKLEHVDNDTDTTHIANISTLSSMTVGSATSPIAKLSTARRRSSSGAKKRSNSHEDHSTTTAAAKPELQPPLPPRPPLLVPAWLTDTAYVNDTSIPFANRLGQEMLRYCDYTQRIIGRVQLTIEQAIWNLSICVQEIWPEATVTCFGSFSSGLWLPSSDVDVVIMGIPPQLNSHTGSNTPTSRHFMYGADELELLASKISQVPWIHHIEVVKSAKVPVAKLILAENDLRVDISIENMHTRLGIEASVVVREYVGMIPILHPLIIVLKQFLREKGLNDASTGGLSSYCLTLLAFYLVERQGAVRCTGIEVGQLLLDFVEFYGTIFRYATTGISLKAEAFGEYMLDPHTTGFGLSISPQLVIDDPVYLDGQHNAAAGAFAIARVIAAWENAFYALRFHRPTKFTPTPLCQLLHWSGHGEVEEIVNVPVSIPLLNGEEKTTKSKNKNKSKARKKAAAAAAMAIGSINAVTGSPTVSETSVANSNTSPLA